MGATSVARILYTSRTSEDDATRLLVCIELRPTNVFSTTTGVSYRQLRHWWLGKYATVDGRSSKRGWVKGNSPC